MRANNRQSLLGPATDPFSGGGDPWAEAEQFQGVSSSEMQQQQHILQGNAHVFLRLDDIYALETLSAQKLGDRVVLCVPALPSPHPASSTPPPHPPDCRVNVPRQCV